MEQGSSNVDDEEQIVCTVVIATAKTVWNVEQMVRDDGRTTAASSATYFMLVSCIGLNRELDCSYTCSLLPLRSSSTTFERPCSYFITTVSLIRNLHLIVG